tara:strand:- start:4506 stop:4643 length:138 start_codon:yes stop_codon:yes gene_type:complete
MTLLEEIQNCPVRDGEGILKCRVEVKEKCGRGMMEIRGGSLNQMD